MKISITVLALLLSIVSFAQKFEGKATYKTHRKFDLKLSKEGKPLTDMQKSIREQLKKQFQKTYTLNFTKDASLYTQNQELAKPQVKKGGFNITVTSGANDILYKNITEKRFAKQTEISGKRFLIKDELKKQDWKLTSETKSIGKYTCYKATRSKEVERMKFSTEDNKETKEKVTIKTVAWYTAQIPISNGPSHYWGLPGLILEIQEGKQTIVCSEIVLNPSEKIVIEEPIKGKKVSQKKFDDINEKQQKEMIERYKSSRKSKNGSTMVIEIGG